MNRILRTGLLAGVLAGSMAGLGYASVPLYRAFCEATGFAGTTQRATSALAPGAVKAGKTISIRFDGNRAPTLPWEFAPERPRETVSIGERDMAFFAAKNLSARAITGRATYNVTPTQAGKYFTKIQCFCFTEQTLKPGEEVRMPVVFYVDPKILDDPDAKNIGEITLSYTFYPVDEGKKPS
jgi:cytochrome c oxidase assembly protein subunit 11